MNRVPSSSPDSGLLHLQRNLIPRLQRRQATTLPVAEPISVRALTVGATLADILIVKNKKDQIDTSVQADILIEDAGEHEYGLQKLAVDSVGLGVGVVNAPCKQGYLARENMSRAKPDSSGRLSKDAVMPVNFDNLRCQMIYL